MTNDVTNFSRRSLAGAKEAEKPVSRDFFYLRCDSRAESCTLINVLAINYDMQIDNKRKEAAGTSRQDGRAGVRWESSANAG